MTPKKQQSGVEHINNILDHTCDTFIVKLVIL